MLPELEQFTLFTPPSYAGAGSCSSALDADAVDPLTLPYEQDQYRWQTPTDEEFMGMFEQIVAEQQRQFVVDTVDPHELDLSRPPAIPTSSLAVTPSMQAIDNFQSTPAPNSTSPPATPAKFAAPAPTPTFGPVPPTTAFACASSWMLTRRRSLADRHVRWAAHPTLSSWDRSLFPDVLARGVKRKRSSICDVPLRRMGRTPAPAFCNFSSTSTSVAPSPAPALATPDTRPIASVRHNRRRRRRRRSSVKLPPTHPDSAYSGGPNLPRALISAFFEPTTLTVVPCRWPECASSVRTRRSSLISHLKNVHGVSASNCDAHADDHEEGESCTPSHEDDATRARRAKPAGQRSVRCLWSGCLEVMQWSSFARHLEGHVGQSSGRCRLCQGSIGRADTARRHIESCWSGIRVEERLEKLRELGLGLDCEREVQPGTKQVRLE